MKHPSSAMKSKAQAAVADFGSDATEAIKVVAVASALAIAQVNVESPSPAPQQFTASREAPFTAVPALTARAPFTAFNLRHMRPSQEEAHALLH
jgi:hypothetical protein